MDKFLSEFSYWLWLCAGLLLVGLLIILAVVMTVDMNREWRTVINYIPPPRR